ncbi:SGNH/GDSL hydrolase family protein [Streptomyces sp. TRM 70361]|uniref:SGNH/GDSL hydrolase family protein n=1 Tax=Streptomyces sp. TRM 70361 TaxID=3116553 RepID=UPI002E7AD91E|nr:SGNH/GDSL hydrolase family protein [Streptomyces sp. TRM 70361]MEE1941476.1 SGNH/GDSL hydrolase family protein [Streptomyces sp. TRM 70361]
MDNKTTRTVRPAGSTVSAHPARRTTGLGLAAAAAVLGLTACGGADTGIETDNGTAATGSGTGATTDGQPSGTPENGAKPQRLLWMGDSIAEVEAPALGAALEAARVEFASMAATGGGGVVGEVAEPTWKSLPQKLESFAPDVVAYQISTYDWGTPGEQRAAYERLAGTVNDAGAELVIVSAPPIKMDEFYKPHEAEIEAAPKSAEEVADEHPDTVRFLESAALWGTDSTADRAQRSKDGIHSCQQGSAAFAKWFGEELGRHYDFTPAPAEEWANGEWTGDEIYGRLGCR